MFGYIIINKQELKLRDYDIYRSFYCGVCHELRTAYGLTGKALLNYDLVFLALLLTGLYEEEPRLLDYRCPHHAFRSCPQRINRYTAYAADITVLFSYYQCRDQWLDDRRVLPHAEELLLKRSLPALKEKYPRQFQAVADYVTALTAAEQRQERDLDTVAGLSGTMLAEIYACHEDEWADELRRLGFYLGKFIYLMDAYEDAEKDRAKGAYNPLLLYFGAPDATLGDAFEAGSRELLTAMLAECARSFEFLPVLTHAEILRNILYSGIWSKFELVHQQREERKRNEEGHGSV